MKALLKTIIHIALFGGVVVALICGIFYAFFVDVVEIQNNGMAPTLFAGDQVLVWQTGNADMGDILVCDHPQHPERFVVGRLFAKPGMRIEVERRNVTVEGERSVVDVLSPDMLFVNSVTDRNEHLTYGTRSFGSITHQYFEHASRMSNLRSRTVGDGYFLVGDHRGKRQYDSRSFGEVRPSTCHGVVFARLRASETQEAPEGISHGDLDIIQ